MDHYDQGRREAPLPPELQKVFAILPIAAKFPSSNVEIWPWFKIYNADKPYHEQVWPWDTIAAYSGLRDEGYLIAPDATDLFNPDFLIDRDTLKLMPDETKLTPYLAVWGSLAWRTDKTTIGLHTEMPVSR
jgi:hypothetical protein